MAHKRHSPKLYFLVVVFASCVIIASLFIYITKRSQIINQQVKQQNQFAHLLLIERRKNTPLTLPILMYHYVEVVTDLRDTIRQSMSVRPEIFAEQLTTLLQNGYTPVRLNDVSDYYSGTGDLPPKPVVFTFDDGYRDFYTDVLPILQKYHVPAVAYVVSGYLDTTQNYLTTPQLLEIQDSGLVEIAAHSVSHRNFLYINQADALYEMKQSKRELEALLGIPIRHFAYPYGVYDSNIVLLAEKTGFESAATVDRGVIQTYKNRFQLKRIRVGSLLGDALVELLTRPL